MNHNPFLSALNQFSSDFELVANKETELLAKKNILEQKLEKALLINNKNINQESSLSKTIG